MEIEGTEPTDKSTQSIGQIKGQANSQDTKQDGKGSTSNKFAEPCLHDDCLLYYDKLAQGRESPAFCWMIWINRYNIAEIRTCQFISVAFYNQFTDKTNL